MLKSLYYWRMMRALTLEELAKKAGINYTTLSKVENLKQSPFPKTIRAIAEALDVSVEQLYQEPPEPFRKKDKDPKINPLHDVDSEQGALADLALAS